MEPASIWVRMNWKETYSIADRGCPTAIRKGKEGGHVTYRNFGRIQSLRSGCHLTSQWTLNKYHLPMVRW